MSRVALVLILVLVAVIAVGCTSEDGNAGILAEESLPDSIDVQIVVENDHDLVVALLKFAESINVLTGKLEDLDYQGPLLGHATGRGRRAPDPVNAARSDLGAEVNSSQGRCLPPVDGYRLFP